MGFFDALVPVDRPLWRRMQMLVNELVYMQTGEELSGLDLEQECEQFGKKIIEEYVRQYFEESTRAAAEMLSHRNQKAKSEPRLWLRSPR